MEVAESYDDFLWLDKFFPLLQSLYPRFGRSAENPIWQYVVKCQVSDRIDFVQPWFPSTTVGVTTLVVDPMIVKDGRA
jgi:hypothetical protein